MKNGDYRGKGECKTRCKGTDIPKHAGNFSYSTIHFQSLQSKEHKVRRINGHLIVGDHTPLLTLFPAPLVELAMTDEHFHVYTQRGIHKRNGKEYDAYRILTKFRAYGSHMYLDFEFVMREEIYTDGDFNYQFKEY